MHTRRHQLIEQLDLASKSLDYERLDYEAWQVKQISDKVKSISETSSPIDAGSVDELLGFKKVR